MIRHAVTVARCITPISFMALAITLGVSVCACRTGAVLKSAATLAPAGKEVGRLVIIREAQTAGSAVVIPVTVDGRPVARLAAGEYVDLPIAVGRHVVAFGPSGTPHERWQRFIVAPASTTYFMYGFAFGGPSPAYLRELPAAVAGTELERGDYNALAASP
jgi:hypothetical protein